MKLDIKERIQQHDVYAVMDAMDLPTPYFVAGGAIRALLKGKPITSDVDVFFQSEADYKKGCAKLAPYLKAENDYNSCFIFPLADKKYKVQCIKFYHPTCEALIDSFDFTICQFAIASDAREVVVTTEYALLDLLRSRLVLHKLTFAVSTMRRLVKYARAGFTFCSGTIQSILDAAVENPETITTEIRYID